MGNFLLVTFMVVVGIFALGPAVLEIKNKISARVARKDSR